MIAVVQRVTFSRVIIDNQVAGEITHGLNVLLGIGQEDNFEDVDWLSKKLSD